MGMEWYIGTIKDEPSPADGSRHSTFDLAVQIAEDEHEELRDAANAIRMTLRGVLFRLVYSNHHTLHDLHDRLQKLLTSDERRSVNWGEAHIQIQLVFANWLGSVRWLLDHTKTRLHDEPEKLQQYETATRTEFDGYFAYRLTSKLRDYTTHCDLPPLFMHVESRLDPSAGRVDRLEIQLRPDELLSSWSSWGAPVTRDLRAMSEPIDLMPLVDEAMACVERMMLVIIAADAHEHRALAQKVVDAVERLPEKAGQDGAVPMLFAADIDGDSITNVSPTPLPIDFARDMLNPPSASRGSDPTVT
jgi:hypothetical protein